MNLPFFLTDKRQVPFFFLFYRLLDAVFHYANMKSKTFFFLLLCSSLHAEKMTEQEKADYHSKVKALLQLSQSAIKKKNKKTHDILKEAAKNKTTCLNLHYDAVKEINFTSKGKKHSDFIAWRKQNRSKLTHKSSQHWLQAQVRWLNFAVESKNLEDDPNLEAKFIKALNKYLHDFYQELEQFSQNSKEAGISLQNEFRKNIMQSEISQFLEIQHATKNNWPHNPSKIAAIYDNHLLPYIRKKGSTKQLIEAWEKRINYEEQIIQALHGLEKKGLRQKTGILEKQFHTKVKPKLLWNMYQDLYKQGEERKSANKMIEHIKKHKTHPDSSKWTKQLLQLLQPAASN